MHSLESRGRLFTYKVRADRGTAPNPYGGVCSLAICKPKIRSAAKRGDIIVGFGCKDSNNPDEEFRIVYAMQVGESLDWNKYIKKCEEELNEKIPTGAEHPGDCIYLLDQPIVRCESWSLHKNDDYKKDVSKGKRVLLSSPDKYWYFGRGGQIECVLPHNLRGIVPMKQGHRSDGNDNYVEQFVKWFNAELVSMKIDTAGRYGFPKDPAPKYSPEHNGSSETSTSFSKFNNVRPIEPIEGLSTPYARKRGHGCH